MMKEKKHWTEIEPGRGSLKYYTYWIPGLRNTLKTKQAIKKALDLSVQVYRKDRLTGKVEVFDFKTEKFEDEKRCAFCRTIKDIYLHPTKNEWSCVKCYDENYFKNGKAKKGVV